MRTARQAPRLEVPETRDKVARMRYRLDEQPADGVVAVLALSLAFVSIYAARGVMPANHESDRFLLMSGSW